MPRLSSSSFALPPIMSTDILVFAVICVGTSCGPWMFQHVKSKFKSIVVDYIVNREIIIVPPPIVSTTTADADNETRDRPQRHVLLTMFPGAFLDQKEYISIAKEAQRQIAILTSPSSSLSPSDDNDDVDFAAADWKVTVGIGPLMYFMTSPWVKWAFDNDNAVVAMWIRKKAAVSTAANNATKQQRQKVENAETIVSSCFDDIFLWGHSFGCYGAIDAAYPSVHSGMILFGGSWDMFLNKTPQDLISYPRPTLTMIGERDGHIRYLLLSKDLKCRQDHLKDTLLQVGDDGNDAIGKKNHEEAAVVLEKSIILTKPIISFPEMNHMHMSMGVVPLRTRLTGRSDLTTNYDKHPLNIPQSILAKTVADFMFIHSKQHQETKIQPKGEYAVTLKKTKQQAEERLLASCQRTEATLQPFVTLSSQRDKTRNVQRLVRSYVSQGISPASSSAALTIIAEWRETEKDFLYCKPRLEQQTTQQNGNGGTTTILYLQLFEQDPINLATFYVRRNKGPSSPPRIAQLSKSLVVKSKSLTAIRAFLGIVKDEDEEPTTATTTDPADDDDHKPNYIQRMNEGTFNHVLSKVVTPEQRKRYLEEGSPLIFGPDLNFSARRAPVFVATPIQLTRQPLLASSSSDNNNNDNNTPVTKPTRFTYTLRSPFIETPEYKQYPMMGGMYYFKPFTPGQAYEWIVFDCFKKI